MTYVAHCAIDCAEASHEADEGWRQLRMQSTLLEWPPGLIRVSQAGKAVFITTAMEIVLVVTVRDLGRFLN